MLTGLDWTAVGERVDAYGLAPERRARALDLLGAIEAGALAAAAQRRSEQGEG